MTTNALAQEENPYVYCSGVCGRAYHGDCYCHEGCDAYPCRYCEWEGAREREEAHGEALADIAYAPTLRPGEIPGDSIGLAGRGPERAPWWWNRPGAFEWETLRREGEYRGYIYRYSTIGTDGRDWAEERESGAL